MASLLFAAAVVLAGCGTLTTDQGPDEVVFRIGNEAALAPRDVRPYARQFLPYALFSARAYDEISGKIENIVDESCKRPGAPPAQAEECFAAKRRLGELAVQADPWFKGWRYIRSWESDGKCHSERLVCWPLGGLVVHLWAHRDAAGACDEFVIAFRGTDFESADDWLSNFRWFTRLVPLYDQYDHVKDITDELVAAISAYECPRAPTVRVVTTGHSLGGGLAHLAAYADATRLIRHVYAFDPSSVTGWFDVPAETRESSKIGLRAERVYERGEILAILRGIMRLVFPVTAKDAQIRQARLATAKKYDADGMGGGAIGNHNILLIVRGLLDWSGDPDAPSPAPCKPLPGPIGAPPELDYCPKGAEMAAQGS